MKEDNVYTVSLVFAHQIKHKLVKERHMYITISIEDLYRLLSQKILLMMIINCVATICS